MVNGRPPVVAWMEVLRTLEHGLGPADLAGLGRRSGRAEWVAAGQFLEQYLSVLDAASKEELRRIPMKASAGSPEGRLFGDQFGDSPVPIGILIPPDGRRAYVANANADVIAVIDLETWTIVGALTAGKEPDGLGYSPLTVSPAPAVAPSR